MAISYSMTCETYIRLGMIARKVWPRLTGNCRILIMPYQPGTITVQVYMDPVLRMSVRDLPIAMKEVAELFWDKDYSTVGLLHFGNDAWPMIDEWYMGADEEYNILVVMQGGHK